MNSRKMQICVLLAVISLICAFCNASEQHGISSGKVAEAHKFCGDNHKQADCQKRDRPNILYIFTDDQSYRSVSAYERSHDWVKTPNIDSLADSGMRFTQCYTGAWCQPSRATALTGLLQHGMKTFQITK